MYMNVTVTPAYIALRAAGKDMNNLPLLSEVFANFAEMHIVPNTDSKDFAMFTISDDTFDATRTAAENLGYLVERADDEGLTMVLDPRFPNIAF